MKNNSKTFGLIVVAFVALELAVRASGVIDFPLYNLDGEISYFLKENQSGIFLHKNDWYTNDKSMPIALNWDPTLHPNILLIGNSIVMGGDQYRQQDKLVPQIQKRLGGRPVVWPIAAGGWTQINEMMFLNRHPEIVDQADYFAWEYMSNGLIGAHAWSGEYMFPTHRPVYATWYVLRRYILPRLFSLINTSDLPVHETAEKNNVGNFDAVLAALTQDSDQVHRHGGIIWLYPNAEQLDEARRGKEWLPERQRIKGIADKRGLRLIDIAANLDWNRSLYRDDGIHPNVQGIRILASILCAEFTKDIELLRRH